MLQKFWPTITLQFQRFAKVTVTDLKRGEWIRYNGKPHFIVGTNSVQSGRSSRVYFLQLKPVDSDSIFQVKPTPNEGFEVTSVGSNSFRFQYEDDNTLYLLNERTFEEVCIPKRQVDKLVFNTLEPGQRLRVKCEGTTPLFVEHVRSVEVTVKHVEMIEEKKAIATLMSGMQVSVPPFIKAGDKIQVDAQNNCYLHRNEEHNQ